MKTVVSILFVCFVFLPILGYSQYNGSCKYPIDTTADELVKSVISITNKTNDSFKIDRIFNSERFKKEFYNSDLNINYDSVFTICFQFLIQKLGRYQVCNNIDIIFNTWNVSEDKSIYYLTIAYTYPFTNGEKVVKLKNQFSFDRKIFAKFEYNLNDLGKIQIKLPSNLPDCNGLENNCFKITEQDVLKGLKSRFLIRKKDKIHMFVEGDHWKVGLTDDGINFRNLTVDLMTGKFSKVTKLRPLSI